MAEMIERSQNPLAGYLYSFRHSNLPIEISYHVQMNISDLPNGVSGLLRYYGTLPHEGGPWIGILGKFMTGTIDRSIGEVLFIYRIPVYESRRGCPVNSIIKFSKERTQYTYPRGTGIFG
jgi:hypothetical protein